jgi:hypothetical protein
MKRIKDKKYKEKEREEEDEYCKECEMMYAESYRKLIRARLDDDNGGG